MMPADDYMMEGGLDFKDLVLILDVILDILSKTGRIRGIDVTIFYPALDSSGELTGSLVNPLVEALT